jgi:DNA-directed RNA polymerase subunit RPC12/RpoP
MIKCQNCGHANADDVNFCRFCGTKITLPPMPQQQAAPRYDVAPPRPYAWKTDEFQTQTEPRKDSDAIAPVDFQSQYQAAVAFPQYGALAGNYHCPRCGTAYLPIIERRVSTAGWIVFSVLLVFTLIFFWIGLLMKEDVAVCPVCRARLN